MSPFRLAKDLAVPPMRVSEIGHGLRGISANTALRRLRYLGTTAEFWMNLQSRYDLERTRDEADERICREPRLRMPVLCCSLALDKDKRSPMGADQEISPAN